MVSDYTIYTDGSCLGNPGSGGVGVVIVRNGQQEVRSAGFKLTTNNRMELEAAIVGIEALPDGKAATLYTDSKYLADAINLRRVYSWRARGWRRKRGGPTKNTDLWIRLLAAMANRKISIKWNKGLNGNVYFRRADRLASASAHGDDLGTDEGYERTMAHQESVMEVMK